jgi:hypothetical protein
MHFAIIVFIIQPPSRQLRSMAMEAIQKTLPPSLRAKQFTHFAIIVSVMQIFSII